MLLEKELVEDCLFLTALADLSCFTFLSVGTLALVDLSCFTYMYNNLGF